MTIQPNITATESPTVNSYRCQVVAHDWINTRYKHIRLKADTNLASITHPGQFYQLKCPQTNDLSPFLLRPMSVYGVGPEPESIEFLYNVTGKGTLALSSLEINAEMDIVGPLGNRFTFESKFKHVIFVARGVGLATMASLLKQAAAAHVKITAIMSARHPDDLMQDQFLQGVDKDMPDNIQVHCVYDHDQSSSVESVDAYIRQLIASSPPDMIYTCGSHRILMMLQKILNDHPKIQGEVAMEQQMACGMGVCLSCVKLFRDPNGETSFKRICREGPVFAIRDVVGEVSFE